MNQHTDVQVVHHMDLYVSGIDTCACVYEIMNRYPVLYVCIMSVFLYVNLHIIMNRYYFDVE